MFGQQILTGLVVGGVYALFALGFTLVFGIHKILNLAHGAVFMTGAFAALYAVQGGLPLWLGYFSNDNLLYAVNNRVGAAAVEAWMPRPATMLELGGGLASGAAAVLEALGAAGRLADVRSYRFTELVPAFLRRDRHLQVWCW